MFFSWLKRLGQGKPEEVTYNSISNDRFKTGTPQDAPLHHLQARKHRRPRAFGTGLSAEDIQLFLENYSKPLPVLKKEFVEVETSTDNNRPELTAAIAMASSTEQHGRSEIGPPVPKNVLHGVSDGGQGAGLKSPKCHTRQVPTTHLRRPGRVREISSAPEPKQH